MSEWITIQIKRPEGYEDVCDMLVAVDCMDSAGKEGWEWRLPEPTTTKPNRRGRMY